VGKSKVETFIGVGEGRRGVDGSVMASFNDINSIEGGARLRGV
jgi:hypothetical protein